MIMDRTRLITRL